MNTSVEGLTQGALDDEALSLVDEQIRCASDKRLVLVMHHPPLVLGLQQFDGFCKIERGDELLNIIAASAQEIIVLSGHQNHFGVPCNYGSMQFFISSCWLVLVPFLRAGAASVIV